MDWPTAATVLGGIGTGLTVFARLYPLKTVVQDHKGIECATKDQAEQILTQVAQSLRNQSTLFRKFGAHEEAAKTWRERHSDELKDIDTGMKLILERIRK